jgi:hypothetical protein
MRSTEVLRARKQAHFVEIEEELFAALCELWPQPERRITLRLVAMTSIGAMRLAMESWRQDSGKRPVGRASTGNFRRPGGRNLKRAGRLSLTSSPEQRPALPPGFYGGFSSACLRHPSPDSPAACLLAYFHDSI